MKPTFLFVHGFGCDGSTWHPQVEALASQFSVTAIDLPGHGSSPLPEVHNLSSLAAAVVEKVARSAQPAILVGHSMGCRVVLEALRLSTEHVVGVAFIDGSAMGRAHAPRLLQMLADRLSTHGLQASLKANVEHMFTSSSSTQIRDEVVSTTLRLDPVFAENMLKDMAQWDAAEALQPLIASGLPVLAIQSTTLDAGMGRRSLVVGETSPWGELVRTSINDVRMRDVVGVGHFVHLEAAAELNEELTRFADELSAC